MFRYLMGSKPTTAPTTAPVQSTAAAAAAGVTVKADKPKSLSGLDVGDFDVFDLSDTDEVARIITKMRHPAEHEECAALIKALVARNPAAVDVRGSEDGSTLLHHAVRSKNYGLIKLLMQCDASVDRTDESGKTALQTAIELNENQFDKSELNMKGCIKAILVSIKKTETYDICFRKVAMSKIDIASELGFSPLIEAISFRDKDAIRKYIRDNVTLDEELALLSLAANYGSSLEELNFLNACLTQPQRRVSVYKTYLHYKNLVVSKSLTDFMVVPQSVKAASVSRSVSSHSDLSASMVNGGHSAEIDAFFHANKNTYTKDDISRFFQIDGGNNPVVISKLLTAGLIQEVDPDMLHSYAYNHLITSGKVYTEGDFCTESLIQGSAVLKVILDFYFQHESVEAFKTLRKLMQEFEPEKIIAMLKDFSVNEAFYSPYFHSLVDFPCSVNFALPHFLFAKSKHLTYMNAVQFPDQAKNLVGNYLADTEFSVTDRRYNPKAS